MAWTEITRRKYRRDGLRYASDTTDAEWTVIEPHMPPSAHCGRPRGTSLREVVNAIFYIALYLRERLFRACCSLIRRAGPLGATIHRPVLETPGLDVCPDGLATTDAQ